MYLLNLLLYISNEYNWDGNKNRIENALSSFVCVCHTLKGSIQTTQTQSFNIHWGGASPMSTIHPSLLPSSSPYNISILNTLNTRALSSQLYITIPGYYWQLNPIFILIIIYHTMYSYFLWNFFTYHSRFYWPCAIQVFHCFLQCVNILYLCLKPDGSDAI